MNLALIGNTALRAAIQCNLVSFSAQIPALTKGGDALKRIVQLYFVRGWPTRAICDRYRLSRYIQDIRPDRSEASERSARGSVLASSESAWDMALFRPARVVSTEVRL